LYSGFAYKSLRVLKIAQHEIGRNHSFRDAYSLVYSSWEARSSAGELQGSEMGLCLPLASGQCSEAPGIRPRDGGLFAS